MITHDLTQGSDAWCQYRLEHFGASEAAAMLGLSTKVKRTELLHMKKTGTAREFSDWVQSNILDYGHEVEDMARPLVEAMIGEGLYTPTCSVGKLSASLDGLTMAEDIAFEHKQWNQALVESVSAGVLPDEYMPQCQQIMMVTGASKVIFVVSDGTKENMVWMDVLPDAAWADRITAGWAQFERDLADYVPVPSTPVPVGRMPETLPSLVISVTGAVTASNLAEFKKTAIGAIQAVNRDLVTDQDFADNAKAIKWCADIEDRVKAAKENALGQTASIDALFRTMDEISAEARTTRIELERLDKARKENIRAELVADGVKGLRDHIAECNALLGHPYMPTVPADFGAAIKGKRTIDSLRDAVQTTLANAKIEASAIFNKIQFNCELLNDYLEYAFLFPDSHQILLKASDDFKALVQNRIAEHKAKEAATRARIRDEEQAKAQRDAAATQAEAIADAQYAVDQSRMNANASGQPAPVAQHVTFAQVAEIMPPAVRAAMAPKTSAPDLKLGQIADRLGFSLTADFLKSLGFEPAAIDRASKLYHSADLPLIGTALVGHVRGVLGLQSPATAHPTDKVGLAAEIADHKKAIAALEQQIEDIDSALENNIYESHDDAEGYITERYQDIAADACDGRHCMGLEKYEQQYQIRGNPSIFQAVVSFEYNRHDKTYYYVDGTEYSYSLLDAPVAA